MTSVSFTRRLALLAALSSGLWLAACGGNGDGSGSASVRALNLSSDLPSADIYIGGNKQFSAQGTGAVSSYTTVDANTYTVSVNAAGDGASLLSGSYSLAKDKHYTAVVWGRQNALRLSTIPEDEDPANITSGLTRVRFFNATVDSGSVDVYITPATIDIGDASPNQSALTMGTLGGFREISPGTYRLRVTGTGDPNDIRLDVPSITIPSGVYTTLVITAGGGGVLVNGTLVQQQAGVTSLPNTNARVRLVASVPGAGSVTATVGTSTVATSLRSPGVAPYALVPAGSQTTTVKVGGTTVSTLTSTFTAGADYSLLAYGASDNTTHAVLIADDNRLPTVTTRAKIRIVDGLASTDPLTLRVDYATQTATSNITSGTASSYATITAAGSSRLDVVSSAADPLFSSVAASGTTLLQAQGVYTVFMLGGQSAPAGILSRDR